ncbi:hypothetical protein A2Z67_05100 [Candidatus Woesebacteria bacterium RBG_13_36_22]|uniref:PARP-type domain-containing protein n=1 Tax=Candidatus Woesebacteria bacterium RBG_13_36_22 TaxID=1802478 RepID=A0A1F7X3L6_9BACT|nr:MAG: hypothetical protein A2Z67_05100 [Candidatus Woesebacteria bacterium RBG_13_36_22]
MNNLVWEKAKSSRSHCRKCNNYIFMGANRLKVSAKFGTRNGFIFYCEACATSDPQFLYNLGAPAYREVTSPTIFFGEGRFRKYLRKIRISDGD